MPDRREGPIAQPTIAGTHGPMLAATPRRPPGPSCQKTAAPTWWAGLTVVLATLMLWPSVLSAVVQIPRPETIRSSVVFSELAVVLGWTWHTRRVVVPARVHPVTGILFLGWALAAIGATFWAVHPVPAALRSAEWVSHALFGIVLWIELYRNSHRVAELHRAIAVGFVVVTGLIAVNALLMADAAGGHNWMHHVPFLGHARHFGIYAFAGLTFATRPLLDPNVGRRSVWWAIGGMTLAWGVLFWTGGRASVGAAMLVGGMLWAMAREQKAGVAAGFCSALVAGALLSLCFPVEHGGGGLWRILGMGQLGDASAFTSGRTELWATTLAAWSVRPWLGMGPDASTFLLSSHGHVQPHNLVVQALVEWGIVGCAAFLALLGVVLYTALIGVWREKDVALRAGRAVSMAFLLGATAHAMLDGLFYDPRTLLVLTVAVSVALLPVEKGLPDRALRSRVRAALALGVLVLVAACGAHLAAVRAVWAPGTPTPLSARVALVKAVPSPLYLRETARWADEWADEHPDEALQLVQWGAQHARFPWFYLRKEGDLLRQRGLRVEAEKRYVQASRLEREALRYRPSAAR